jgi:tetratricopeptide (TPR) repeat protein
MSSQRRHHRHGKPTQGALLLRLGRQLMDPRLQYLFILLSALGFAALLFSGFLLFRFMDTQDLLQHGKQLLAEGKVARAVEVFEQLVQADANHYEGHVRLGQAYLELGDKRKAEQEFKIASLLKSEMANPQQLRGGLDGVQATIAMAKLAIARNQFEDAEALIQEALAQGEHTPLLQEALYDLYTHWGNYLMAQLATDKKATLAPAIEAYGQAIHYAPSYYLETQSKDKLSAAVTAQLTRLEAKKPNDPAIGQLLETLLKYNYSAETLLKLVQWYESQHQLEPALKWARKAFEISPASMSLKFSNLLIERGHELAKANKPEQAQSYYTEAERIGELAHLRYDQLFPVQVKGVAIQLKDADHATGRFTPDIRVTLANESQRPLDFLAVKLEFYKGDKRLETIIKSVITPASPLAAKDPPDKKGKAKTAHVKTVSLTLPKPLYLHQLGAGGAVSMKVFIAYSEGEGQEWYLKTLRDLRIVIPSPEPEVPEEEGDDSSTEGETKPSSPTSPGGAPVPSRTVT